MGWRGRGGGWGGSWPGRGPFSYLPPWQRPGWLYGRGSCWWLYAPYLRTTVSTIPGQASALPTVPTVPFMPTLTKVQEVQMLDQQMKFLQSQLETIRKRIKEISG